MLFNTSILNRHSRVIFDDGYVLLGKGMDGLQRFSRGFDNEAFDQVCVSRSGKV